MPTWNKDNNRYEEEPISVKAEDYAVTTSDLPLPKAELDAQRREETFRTALLNELDLLTRAVYSYSDWNRED